MALFRCRRQVIFYMEKLCLRCLRCRFATRSHVTLHSQWKSIFDTRYRLSCRFVLWKHVSTMPAMSASAIHRRQPSDMETRPYGNQTINLWRLVTNADYRTIGYLFGVSKASVSIIVDEFCKPVKNHLLPQFVKIPSGKDLDNVINQFKCKWGFP